MRPAELVAGEARDLALGVGLLLELPGVVVDVEPGAVLFTPSARIGAPVGRAFRGEARRKPAPQFRRPGGTPRQFMPNADCLRSASFVTFLPAFVSPELLPKGVQLRIRRGHEDHEARRRGTKEKAACREEIGVSR